MINSVIFDFDGVIIDSEKLHQDRMIRFANYYNLDIDPKLFLMLIGSNPKMDTMRMIYNKANLDITFEEFDRMIKEYDVIEPKESLDYSNALFPHVKEVLTYLKDKGYKLAIASSSSLDYIVEKLQIFGLYDYFDVINSGRELKESKPNPMIYLKTINDLNTKADECAIIEDSCYGVLAASRACCFVIGRKDFRYPTDLSLCNEIVEDLIEITNIL